MAGFSGISGVRFGPVYTVPLPTPHAWISAYFMSSQKRVGVYFRCENSQAGREIAQRLDSQKDEIISELGGSGVRWNMLEDGGGASVSLPCQDVFDPGNKTMIKDFFKQNLNTFVNVFRPRLKGLD